MQEGCTKTATPKNKVIAIHSMSASGDRWRRSCPSRCKPLTTPPEGRLGVNVMSITGTWVYPGTRVPGPENSRSAHVDPMLMGNQRQLLADSSTECDKGHASSFCPFPRQLRVVRRQNNRVTRVTGPAVPGPVPGYTPGKSVPGFTARWKI